MAIYVARIFGTGYQDGARSGLTHRPSPGVWVPVKQGQNPKEYSTVRAARADILVDLNTEIDLHDTADAQWKVKGLRHDETDSDWPVVSEDDGRWIRYYVLMFNCDDTERSVMWEVREDPS